MSATSDIPTGLDFVDPAETDHTYRVVLFAAPGSGKSVAAASAPGPVLILSADRPSAYRFARKHHHPKVLQEVRYRDASTLDEVYKYLRDGNGIRTIVIDPIGNIVDHLVDTMPARADGDPDYQAVNKKLLGFIKSLRAFDINVVIVAHEKLNDSKKGDGKIYPAIGGMGLINKTLAEMDLVAHIERVVQGEGDEQKVLWIGQLQPRDNIVVKDGLGVLGERRIADLSRWFEVATAELAPADDDLPFTDEPDEPEPHGERIEEHS